MIVMSLGVCPLRVTALERKGVAAPAALASAAAGNLRPQQQEACVSPSNMPRCSGRSCGNIDIRCDGDIFTIDRGMSGYGSNEYADISFVGPTYFAATVHTEYSHDRLTLDTQLVVMSGITRYAGDLTGHAHVLTWSSDYDTLGQGWTVTLSPPGSGPGVIVQLLALLILCCPCIAGLLCCYCCSKGRAPPTPSAGVETAPNQQLMQFAQQPAQNPAYQFQQPMGHPMSPDFQAQQPGQNPAFQFQPMGQPMSPDFKAQQPGIQ